MPIPEGYGISKIRLIISDEPRRDRQPRPTGLKFELEQGQLQSVVVDEEGGTALPPRPSFNVLYVQTPRVNAFHAPLLAALGELLQETREYLKPLGRLGLPETSLFTKCPYYSDELASSDAGHVLINSRLRKVMAGVQSGVIYDSPRHHIKPASFAIPDLPSASLVLALNLGCYWLITKQANRV